MERVRQSPYPFSYQRERLTTALLIIQKEKVKMNNADHTRNTSERITGGTNEIYRNVQKRTGRADCPRGCKAAPHWKESGLRAREKWKSRSNKAGQEDNYSEARSC